MDNNVLSSYQIVERGHNFLCNWIKAEQQIDVVDG